MKHHNYLTELIEKEYFEQTPVFCQDTGIIPRKTLIVLSLILSQLTPYYFQGILQKNNSLPLPTNNVCVEDEDSAKYFIPSTNRMVIASFYDTREHSGVDAVFNLGYVSFFDMKINSYEEKLYSSFSCSSEQITKLSGIYQQKIVDNIFSTGITGLKQLALIHSTKRNILN